jgi:HlyD family secretion protein
MAEVTLQLPPVTQALLIPNAALRQHGGQTGAWLNNAGRLRFAALKTGARGLDGKVQVLDGLQDGDTVVVYSERELADNQRIEVVTSLTGSHAP